MATSRVVTHRRGPRARRVGAVDPVGQHPVTRSRGHRRRDVRGRRGVGAGRRRERPGSDAVIDRDREHGFGREVGVEGHTWRRRRRSSASSPRPPSSGCWPSTRPPASSRRRRDGPDQVTDFARVNTSTARSPAEEVGGTATDLTRSFSGPACATPTNETGSTAWATGLPSHSTAGASARRKHPNRTASWRGLLMTIPLAEWAFPRDGVITSSCRRSVGPRGRSSGSGPRHAAEFTRA